MSRTMLVRLVVGVVMLMTLPMLADGIFSPKSLPNSLLATTRGGSVDFLLQLPNSCAANAFSLVVPLYPKTTFVASCNAGNVGSNAGTCDVSASAKFGKAASIRGDNNGQTNTQGANCGRLLLGQCQLIPLPPGQAGPPGPGVVPTGVAISQNTGNPILCGAVVSIAAQGGGGGGGGGAALGD